MTTTARRQGSGSAVARRGRRRSRLDWLLLRWQARLDTEWVDRTGPWVAAAVMFVVYVTIALARASRLDAGDDLARHLQAAWQLAEGRAPDTTVGAEGNLFADRFPIVFIPIAAVTRVLPAVPTLLAAQAGALSLGLLPLWRLARNVALLRVGAAGTLCLAYALHPALLDLDLGDFHPAALAIAPMLVAAYYAERRRWGRYAVASVLTVVCSSEFGLVIATIGILLILEGERRAGVRSVLGGLAWTFGTLVLVQAPLGNTGLVAPGAFDAYGATALDIVIAMVRNPFKPIGDLLVEANVSTIVWVLAPLAFLPVLAVRRLIPALPITALYLVADVPVRGADGGARMVPFLAFSFVAAAFALARLGRRTEERVVVDRRLLALLVATSFGAALVGSGLSPYGHPWNRSGDREQARRDAIALLPESAPIRVPEALSPPTAERATILLTPVEPEGTEEEPDAFDLSRGVDGLVIDESDYPSLDPVEAYDLRRAIEAEGLAQISRDDGIAVFVRILEVHVGGT